MPFWKLWSWSRLPGAGGVKHVQSSFLQARGVSWEASWPCQPRTEGKPSWGLWSRRLSSHTEVKRPAGPENLGLTRFLSVRRQRQGGVPLTQPCLPTATCAKSHLDEETGGRLPPAALCLTRTRVCRLRACFETLRFAMAEEILNCLVPPHCLSQEWWEQAGATRAERRPGPAPGGQDHSPAAGPARLGLWRGTKEGSAARSGQCKVVSQVTSVREAQAGTAAGWSGHGPCCGVAAAGADRPGGWHGALGWGQRGEPQGKPGRDSQGWRCPQCPHSVSSGPSAEQLSS